MPLLPTPLSSGCSLSLAQWNSLAEGWWGDLADRGLNSSRAPPPGPDEVCDSDRVLKSASVKWEVSASPVCVRVFYPHPDFFPSLQT